MHCVPVGPLLLRQQLLTVDLASAGVDHLLVLVPGGVGGLLGHVGDHGHVGEVDAELGQEGGHVAGLLGQLVRPVRQGEHAKLATGELAPGRKIEFLSTESTAYIRFESELAPEIRK